MGIYRTLRDAQDAPRSGASWIHRVIVEVVLKDGRKFYRSYDSNQYDNVCKRCRKASRRTRRMCSMGRGDVPCPQCGNPFTSMVRPMRRCVNRVANQWEEIRHNCGSGGKAS